MPSLLEISADLQALDDLLAERGGDVSDPDVAAVIDEWFAEISGTFDDKVDNYCGLIRSLELRAAVREEEEMRLARRVRSDRSAAKGLKERLLYVLQERSTPKVETRRYRVMVCANGGQPPMVLNPDVPAEFMFQPPAPPPEPDKEKIRAALAVGELSFAWLLPRGQHLRIS